MKINISRSLLAFGIIVSLGLASAVGLKVYVFERLKVNGPVYQEIVYGKDLIADILPPPLYVVESYMLANEIYAHPNIRTGNLAKIARLQEIYDERRAYWQASTLEPSLNTKLKDDVLVKGDVYWSVLNEQYMPALETSDPNASLIALGELYKAFHTHDQAVNELVTRASTYLEGTEARARATDDFFSITTLAASLISILMFLAGIYLFRRRAIVPLEAMAKYMGSLSQGDYSKEVPYSERTDEIGEMAKSVAYFRKAAMDRKSARLQSEKEQAEIQRLEHEATERQAAENSERIRVIDALTEGLENLSAGNLTYRITESFPGEYEKLRAEFNASVDALGATMVEISATTDAVRMASSELGSAADDLARRTEQQAASLEQTAAALDEITSTVKSSSQRAEEASEMVGQTKDGTEKSACVVENAISAMQKIEDSSKQISRIISVIDDIAFQTNLLALNAGVEAARAGDAGKGFAVVAQEVRELAGRSASAAKEIKTLIETSSTQVGAGVSLVNETGKTLGEIGAQVVRINDHIRSIVTGAREQSNALGEINAAVNEMDQVTQQNAAMVEEANAATQSLSSEAVRLEGLVGRFKTGEKQILGRGHSGIPALATETSRSAASPARALGAKIASVFGGGKATGRQSQWDEF